ncbi:MAG: metal ABC transporter substrate-binding protein [Gemmataceae bacterium]
MSRRMYLFLGAMLLGCLGCTPAADPWDGEGSPRIVVTIPPLASWVRAVAGDRPSVRCLCTVTGPHHYQTDSRDSRLLQGADLFLSIGLRLDDSFAESMRSQARNPKLRALKLGSKIPEKNLLILKHEHNHEARDNGTVHRHGKWDPHVWLGVEEVSIMVEAIRDELIALDPTHAEQYRANCAKYQDDLRKLGEEGKALLAKKSNRRIITFHESLGYLARSFGLEIVDVIETGPGDEPTAAHLAQLVKLGQDPVKPIAAIAVEPQYPKSTSANLLQRELGSRGVKIPLIEVDPLETGDPADLKQEGGAWFLTRMRKNLESLAKLLP